MSSITAIVQAQKRLLNLLSTCLIREPKLEDPKTVEILSLCRKISTDGNAEFLLKLCVYLRQDVGIRTLSNLLLALASDLEPCRPFLAKYANHCINLPSDWLEVIKLYRVLKGQKPRDNIRLPRKLRLALVTKFKTFSEYSLAKYNNTKRKKKEGDLTPTIKAMVRTLHISSPVEFVMKILGKKYPKDSVAFDKSGLPGVFQRKMAGKRMKLDIPATWETQTSMHGNKAEVWEKLLDGKPFSLPFMAMLRNVRNMLKTGISRKHHRMVRSRLTRPTQIARSRQFPYRFFSAYDVVSHFDMSICTGKIRPDASTINKYKDALNVSMKLSASQNLSPIKGSTVVLVDVATNNLTPMSDKSQVQVAQVGALLALMFKSCCEFCTVIAFDSVSGGHETVTDIDSNDMLASVNRIAHMGPLPRPHGGAPGGLLQNLYGQILAGEQRVDSIVLLRGVLNIDTHPLDWFTNRYRKLVRADFMRVEVDLCGKGGARGSDEHPLDFFISGFSDKILQFVAQRGGEGELQYIQRIDEVKRIRDPSAKQGGQKPNARKGGADASGGQTPRTPRESLPEAAAGASKTLVRIQARMATNSLRVFVSSTFSDMHSERNFLQQIVFPAIRRRCTVSGRRVQLVDIDMRWGITSSEIADDPMAAATRCLNEVLQSHIVIGFVGERYGWQPSPEVFKTLQARYPALKTLDHPNPSITDMEMHLGALSRPKHKEALFFLRDPLSSVPRLSQAGVMRYKSMFRDADQGHVLDLRKRIRAVCAATGWVCQGYGLSGISAFTSDLGKADVNEAEVVPAIITQLWSSICRRFPNSTKIDQNQVSTVDQKIFEMQRARTIVGRDADFATLQTFIAEPNANAACELVVTGPSGVGKSGLLAAFAHRIRPMLKKTIVLSHFCGATPSARDLRLTLQRLCSTLIRLLDLDMAVPTTLQQLQMTFTSLLKDISAIRKVLLIIDMPKTEDDVQALANVLQLVPRFGSSNFKVLCTGGGEHVTEALLARQPAPRQLVLGPVDEAAAEELVRKQLANFSKQLEAHQIEAIVHKRDGGRPKYLMAVCSVLRTFSVFDTLSDDIGGMPGTCDLLINKIVDNWEEACGKDAAQLVFSLLSLSKFGLDETGLSHTLAESSIKISRLSLASILDRAAAFLSVSSSTGVIDVHPVLRKCIEKRYLCYTGERKNIHALLYRNCMRVCDPMGDGQWRSKDSIAFRAMHHHGLLGHQTDTMLRTYRSLAFLQSRCMIGDAGDLPGEFTSMLEHLPLTSTARKELDDFRSFVSRNLGVLTDYPELVLPLALNQPADSTVMRHAAAAPSDSWMQCMNKAETEPAGKSNVPISNSACAALAVSADGTYLACGGDDWNVHVLLAKQMKELFCLTGHQGPIRSVAFGGAGDKTNMLVSASEDSSVRVWSLVDGTQLAGLGTQGNSRRPSGHTRAVNAAVFEPSQCELVLSASDDRTLRLWNLETKKAVTTRSKPHDAPISSVEFHQSGTAFVSGSWDGLVVVWKLEGFKCTPLTQFQAHTQAVRSVAFASSLSKVIACSSFDGTGKVFNVDSGQEICTLKGHNGPVSRISFSSVSNTAVTCGDDGTLRVWTTVAGVPLEQLAAHTTAATSAVFATGKQRDDASEQAVSVGADGNVKHWLVQTRSTVEGESLKGVPVTAMAFTQRGAKDPPALLCGSRDGRVFTVPLAESGKTLDMNRTSEFWRTETKHPVEESKSDQPISEYMPLTSANCIGICEDRGAYDSVRAIAISVDGEYTAIAIDDTVRVHCTSTGFDFKLQGESEKNTIGPGDAVKCLQGTFQGQTGKVIRLGRQDASRAVVKWDSGSRSVVSLTFLRPVTAGPQGRPVCALAFHPKKPVLACAGWTGDIVLYNVRKKKSISRIQGKSGQELSAIAFGLRGDLLATVGYRGVVNIYSSRDGTNWSSVAQVSAHKNWALTCALSHSTPMVVSAGLDGVVAVTTASTSDSAAYSPGDEWSVSQRFRGHKGAVNAVAVMTSSNAALQDCIVSCGQDRSVRVWSLLEGAVAIFFCDSPVRSLVLPTTTADTPRIYCGDELGNLKMLQLNITEQESMSSADLKSIELLTTGGVAPAASKARGSDRSDLLKETKNNANNLTYASNRLLVTLVSVNALGFSM